MKKSKTKLNLQCVLMAITFILVNFTSITVVTNIIGFNLPLAFLMSGINTLIFFIITKGKLMSVIGVSGLYIGSILIISQKYGQEYALGGVLLAGILYILFSIIMFKWQDKIFSIIPKWLLSFSIILIGLSLIPIGSDLISQNLLLGLISMIIMVLVDLLGKGKIKLFSMPIAILVGCSVAFLTGDISLAETQSLIITTPKFNLESFLTISLIAFSVVFEAIGDCENTGDVLGVDIKKEVGVGRILLGNGIGSILNGLVGVGSATTYSEQNSCILLTNYKNPISIIFTSLGFILLAFVSPLMRILYSIPQPIFGGCLLYLFATVVINAIKQVMNSGVDLNTERKPFIIMSVMLALFYISFIICGVSIPSIAISMGTGIVLNLIIKDNNEVI